MDFVVEVVVGALAFARLEAEWTALALNVLSPLARFDWYDACRRFYHPGADPVVFVARSQTGAHAIAPLVIERSGPLRRLIPLSHGSWEAGFFIHDDDEALSACCQAVIDYGQPIALKHFYADAPELVHLHEMAGANHTIIRPSRPGSARLAGADAGVAVSRMTAKHRRNIRHRRNAAERQGPVRFELVTPSEANVEAYLEAMFVMEHAGWKGRAGSSLLSQPQQKQFFLAYCRSAARSGILRFFLLRIGEKLAAFQIKLEHGRRLWCLKMGYDESLARFAPGIVLSSEAIAYAAENRLGYEFLGRFGEWQTYWPIDRYELATLYYYPWSFRGLGSFTRDLYGFGRSRLRADQRHGDMSEADG